MGARGRIGDVACGLAALLASACTPPVPPVEVGEVTTAAAETPADLADARWSPVSLPDRWDAQAPPRAGHVWYRFAVPAAAGVDQRAAVFLPRLRMNAAVYVNGAWIGDGGPFAPHVAQNWSRPLYFEFPRSLLRGDGEDVVHVHLFGFPHDRSGLGRIYLGAHEALASTYERQRTLEVDLARVVSFAVLVVVLLLLALLAMGRVPEFRFLLVAAVFLGLHSATAQVWRTPVPYPPVRWALHFAIDGFTVALASFVHRWGGLSRPRVDAALWSLLAIGHAVAALAPAAWFFAVVTVTHAGNLVVGLYTLVTTAQTLRRGPPIEGRIGAAFGAVALAIGGLSFAPYVGLLPPEAPRFIVLMGPCMLLGFGATLIVRLALASRAAALHHEQLAATVQAREVELTREFARTRALEAERAVAEERERLLREMHDGVGGNLVGVLDLVQRGAPSPEELEAALSATLEDMRMVLDSLDPDVDDVPTLLGMMRVRLERRIRAAGVRLDWAVTDLPELAWLGRRELAHVQRIVQEAITNALRHAEATTICVETTETATGVRLTVTDDGRGIPDGTRTGRGLTNMAHRAEAIGGFLSIGSGPAGGTAVSLSLPYNRSTSSSPR
ncbi:MAG: ATP-binding protein [Sandaracinaceae bacterium]